MNPQEIARFLDLPMNRELGAPNEYWYRVIFTSTLDMNAFIDLCEEQSDKHVTPISFMSGYGVAEWWDTK